MKKLNDKIFDLMLEEASQQYVEQIAAKYPSAEELKGRYTFSPEFENWVEGVIQTEEKRLKRIGYIRVWKRILKVSQKVSISICFLFSTLLLLAFTVPPIRIALLNFVTEQHEEYIEVDLKSENEVNSIVVNADINMPQEFVAIDTNQSEALLIIIYENSDGERIHLERYVGSGGMLVDGEDNSFDKITIGKRDGYISFKNDKTTLLFHDGEYGYTMISDIDQNVLIKIAKDIID